MTDNEIIKALECCASECFNACDNCPFYKQCENDEQLSKFALDLINRLQAEIERLNKEVDRLSRIVFYHDGDIIDALTEFAERLTDRADLVKVNDFDSKYAISQDDIDNILKEMEW